MTPTWIEARMAKAERLRREARFFTPDLLSKRKCRCGLRLPLKLTDAGIYEHPTCGPLFAQLTSPTTHNNR